MEKSNVCQVCSVETPDIRHIGIECWYELDEVYKGFEHQTVKVDGYTDYEKRLYVIRVCKGCRSVFMFDYLKHFIEHGARVREAQNIDEDGNMEIRQ